MGWLLTLWLSLPLVDSEVEVRMWFSRETYCDFARQKFMENPMRHTTDDGREADATVTKGACRELTEGEGTLVPEHMRN
jgi:hypothetical protein